MRPALWVLACVLLCGCSKEDTPPEVKDAGTAVEKAYDTTTGALRNVVEDVNDAVYK